MNHFVTVKRPAKVCELAKKLTDQQTMKLLHLGAMRIWALKEALKEALTHRCRELTQWRERAGNPGT